MHASRVVCTVICQSPFLVQVPCNKLFILLLSHHHAARSMSSQVIVVSASDSIFASGIRETSASHKMFCFLRFVKESFSFLRENVDRSCHEAGPVEEDLLAVLPVRKPLQSQFPNREHECGTKAWYYRSIPHNLGRDFLRGTFALNITRSSRLILYRDA